MAVAYAFRFTEPQAAIRFPTMEFDTGPIHRAADRHLAAFRDAFLSAVRVWKRSIHRDAVADGLDQQSRAEVEGLLGDAFPTYYSPRFRAVLPRPIRDGWNTARRRLPPPQPPKTIALVPRFDLSNPRVSQWADRYAADHVVEVTDETRAAIREIVARALEPGMKTPPKALARQVIGEIGLTRVQAQAMAKYRERLVKDGRSDGEIERLMGRYEKAKLKERSEAIARTETISAAAGGQRLLWQEAVYLDYLNPSEWEREWIVTRDDRLCKKCIPMAGKRARLGMPYDVGVMGPALHTRCRCAERLVRVGS